MKRARTLPFVTGPAGLNALADPDFLFGQFFVENRIVLFLGGEELGLADEELFVPAGPGGELAPIEFENAGGKGAQESPVVRNEKNGEVPLFQEFLKPTDSCEVQVIGGFVENQQMGLADQGPGEHGPALVSARKGVEGFVGT